jgi:predicted site-specific integrase-resolvase
MFQRIQIREDATRLFVCHVAEELDVAETTVRGWARAGKLRGHRISVKVWVFIPADVIRFAQERAKQREAA